MNKYILTPVIVILFRKTPVLCTTHCQHLCTKRPSEPEIITGKLATHSSVTSLSWRTCTYTHSACLVATREKVNNDRIFSAYNLIYYNNVISDGHNQIKTTTNSLLI